ncbi:hypothetical protein G5B38_02625 [Pseudohalocynthiibacter aestuariivivens]|nr:hypothetical protein [Pseudohalocynthiibacter aestuariivivens]QIE44512.1 hypothetical protein G5B38_02625 [Pseudohalocynthiibacter aestuariivivens]
MRYFLALILSLVLTMPAAAQTDEPIFKDYADMRATLDGLIMSRDIADVMRAFGGADEMTEQELTGLQERVRRLFPQDFEHVDVMKIDEMGGGWRQELYVYWTGLRYLYVYVLLHDRGDGLIAVHFKFNTTFATLNELF